MNSSVSNGFISISNNTFFVTFHDKHWILRTGKQQECLSI